MKDVENINDLARKTQTKASFFILSFMGILIFIVWIFVPKKATESQENSKKIVKLDGAIDNQFSQQASQLAIEEQQREIKNLSSQLSNVGAQIEILQQIIDELRVNNVKNNSKESENIQARIDLLESILAKKHRAEEGGFEGDSSVRDISVVNFSYKSKEELVSKTRTAKNYVPPGTFVRAVLLSGADTNAGINGQTDTTPITMRILDNGTLPNGEKSSLKGCFVTAAAYGDASSERGQIRLQRLSCVRKPDGEILDITVEGTINDMGGNDGLRGHVVMRNSKLIWNAGVAGLLSGFGNSMKQTLTSQSISALGATSVLKSGGKAFQYGAFGGANTAFEKLADYYIKLADMYHPIVQIHAGSEVNIVFLRGFSLTEEVGVEGLSSHEKDLADRTSESEEKMNENLMQTIRSANLGQGIDYNGTGALK